MWNNDQMIETKHLIIHQATIDLARAEIEDRDKFSALLKADVPDNWPPEILSDALSWFLQQLETNHDSQGWFGWYVLYSNETLPQPTLVGSIGFKGPPQKDNTVEIGYSVLPQFHGKGYATEMINGLVHWAFSHAEVSRIIAETTPNNIPSVRVLDKTGFTPLGKGNETTGVLYELRREFVVQRQT